MQFNFDNTYAQELKGFYEPWQREQVPTPKIIKLNTDLAIQLGLDISVLTNADKEAIFSGNTIPEGATPIAQVYAGHQFGGFSQQLGDGRAMLLGEIIDTSGARFDIQLKGSGRTVYSRGGDGKAALGPVLREYIISEVMHALDIPTTRALAAVTTGENVIRTESLPGAVLTRVAASHIRFGTFQYFAARGEVDKVRQLANYTIARHYPKSKESENPYLDLLEVISEAQAQLVAKWMLIGFIHGVMNTDNMTVSGETIDYGPCAFMDSYDPNTVYSSVDTQGRYAYQNQPPIAQWNLARLAETLLPLIDDDNEKAIELATEVIDKFPDKYSAYWLEGMRKKTGLSLQIDNDLELMNDLLVAMDGQNVDYTTLFWSLAEIVQNNDHAACALFDNPAEFKMWLGRWRDRLTDDAFDVSESIALMKQVNPIYIPRNHKVEEAIEAAVSCADYSKFEKLITTLGNPYEQQEGKDEYAKPAPKEFGAYKTFCGT